jgi:fibronectin type 3 domain-containing protein
VTLEWSPSTSPTVIGYNVYRGMVSGGPYAKINSSVNTMTTYVDGSVRAGTTYYYVVTSVDTSNIESAFSQQESASVPTP